ncbi:MAG TPA: DUF1684 domain-containing protein [Steroidobacteraceae bacterium]|nr:DUF1684 domain-containing protein [Steroidobacteraceae bacterium]
MNALLRVLAIAVLCWIGNVSATPLTANQAAVFDQWRAERVARLRKEDGWLTLVGLYWFKQGENTFGRDSSNTLVLDNPSMPPRLGSFELDGRDVHFTASPGANVTHEGKPVSSIEMLPDSASDTTVLSAGSLRFFVITRSNKIGLRVRDLNSPARTEFKGLEYFPPSREWIVNARFEPYHPYKRIPIVNILGMRESMQSPGAIVFEKDGHTYRLDTVLEDPDDKELFIMFADATSAHETYGAGRFMYVAFPKDGYITVDFNRAYNPPCAFSDFATCPLPPPQNRLSLRVEAGEKKYAGREH